VVRDSSVKWEMVRNSQQRLNTHYYILNYIVILSHNSYFCAKKRMIIALCQINPVIGDLDFNKNKILEGYKKGVDEGADLVIFPELSLTGYPPLDLVERKEFRKAVYRTAEELATYTGTTGLIFGSITEDDDRIGTDLHNSALLCYEGKIQFVQNKSLIPNYDVFDEARYYDPAKEIQVRKFKGVNLGISICEDIWNDSDYWHFRRYVKDPVKELIQKGAEVLINISASPYSYGKREDRKRMLSVLTGDEKIPLAYVCCVGAQTELIFDGASMCFDKKGALVRLGNAYEEEMILFDTEENYPEITECEGSFEEEILTALSFGLKEYCRKTGFKKVVLGLSGGLDSAVVAVIAAYALGNENVHTLLMPSNYSSEGSIKDSKKLIKNLNISWNKISIQPVFDKVLKSLSKIFIGKEEDLTEQNIQSRIRGLYLMAYSNKFNALLLTTGNKSEVATGYATLYGDMAGGLAVIADVYKTDVYRLAEYINREKEIIPREIIEKAPSAELKHNQTDQDSLPPYPLLDKILKMYLEENKEEKEITDEIKDAELVKTVLRMVDFNEFKRRQAAPALRVSNKSFGYGRRLPVTQGWRR
jgi:NAD+ synthase (glutamine-hydrolysing)